MKRIAAFLGFIGLLALVALPVRAWQLGSVTPAASCADSVPSYASTWGYTVCNLNSTFSTLGRVDTTNAGTSTASTDWWVSNTYQNFVVSSGNFSTTSNIMEISQGAGGTNTNNSPSLQSVYLPFGNAYTTWRGRSFKNGFLVRYRYSFNQSLSVACVSGNCNGFPALWAGNWVGVGLPNATPACPHYLEMDFVEEFEGTAGTTFEQAFKHEWNLPGGGCGSTIGTEPSIATLPGPPAWNGTDFHTIDQLWVPTTKNSGTGLVYTYFDGTLITSQSLTYSLAGQPTVGSGGFDGTPANGAFSVAENASSSGFALFITAGNTGVPASGSYGPWPLYIENVEVWQGSSSDMVVQ